MLEKCENHSGICKDLVNVKEQLRDLWIALEKKLPGKVFYIALGTFVSVGLSCLGFIAVKLDSINASIISMTTRIERIESKQTYEGQLAQERAETIYNRLKRLETK